MRRVHPVRISKIGFEFCRYGVAALVWLAVLFNSYEWLVATALLLGASALLKVRKAPMVVLGHFLMGGMLPDKVVVDELGMQFAHVMGFVLNIIVLAVVIFCSCHWVVGNSCICTHEDSERSRTLFCS